MSSLAKYSLTAAILLVLAVAVWFFVSRPAPTPTVVPEIVVSPPPAPPPGRFSALAPVPDWELLEPFQETITRGEFELLLTSVFTTGTGWQDVIEIDDTAARIDTGLSAPADRFTLRFAESPEAAANPPRTWRTASEMPAPAPGKPLDGIHIAIDPGHIGGSWAKMEERWFVFDGGQPVQEGDMTLHVAKLLKPQLEALGATVSLVRENLEPVTPVRPADLLAMTAKGLPAETPPAQIQRDAERLFYRTAEIRARADLVNLTLKPDIVLCLHFNAEAWGDPSEPVLIDRTHLHLLVNGGYTDDEVMLVDQRFAMLQKILQRIHREEVLVGSTIANAFADASGLPPFTYPAVSTSVRAIPGQPYLWARNLLANRLYDCPVVFLEPYVMNSTNDYARIQAGDYEGLRDVAGKLQPSIFREYADAVAAGLKNHYTVARIPAQMPENPE